jgi:hypothetical protein
LIKAKKKRKKREKDQLVASIRLEKLKRFETKNLQSETEVLQNIICASDSATTQIAKKTKQKTKQS